MWIVMKEKKPQKTKVLVPMWMVREEKMKLYSVIKHIIFFLPIKTMYVLAKVRKIVY